MGHEETDANLPSRLHYLFGQAYKPLPLVDNNGLYRRFRFLHHASYLALIRRVAARRARLLRFMPRTCGASLRCQDRTLFRSLDSPGDTGGPLLFSEDNFYWRLRVAPRQLSWPLGVNYLGR